MLVQGIKTETVDVDIYVDDIVDLLMRENNTLEDCIEALEDDFYYYIDIPIDVELSVNTEDDIIETIKEELRKRFND